ncbi:MAG: lipid A-modifier LpxR family protein, partial [Flavobacteriaceae bacterium]
NSDNDAFVAWENRDRYYTYGMGASLAFKAKNLLGLENWFSQKEYNFFRAGIRIEGYTPTNKVVSEEQLQGDSLIVFDRPFAGLLFGTLESTYTFKRSFFTTGVLLGIMGPSSGAGRLQRWIHDNVTDDDVFDGWRFQVPDQFIMNFSGDYVYDFLPDASWFDIYGGAKARLGNLYIDASPVLGFRIGRFNSLGQTVSFSNGLLAGKSDWELYLRSSFSANFAFFNATAQGNLFGPKFEYAVDELNPLFLSMTHGIYFAYRRIVIGYDHFFSYGEVVKKQRHIYARFEFKYRF